jgi:hypothetical protein
MLIYSRHCVTHTNVSNSDAEQLFEPQELSLAPHSPLTVSVLADLSPSLAKST